MTKDSETVRQDHLEELAAATTGWRNSEPNAVRKREAAREAMRKARADPEKRAELNRRNSVWQKQKREREEAARIAAGEPSAAVRRTEAFKRTLRLKKIMIEETAWLLGGGVLPRYIPPRVTNPRTGKPFETASALQMALRRAGRGDLAAHFERDVRRASGAGDTVLSA